MKRTLGLMLVCCLTAVYNAGDASNATPANAGGSGDVVELDGLKSKAPADWKLRAASRKLHKGQFRLPKADGDPADAEIAMFYFDKGGGGSVPDNLKREREVLRRRPAKRSTTLPRSTSSRSATSISFASTSPARSGTRTRRSTRTPRRRSGPITACSASSSKAPTAPTSSR